MFDPKALPRQFIKWAILVPACALPSFLIALITAFHSPQEIGGMIAGIITFVFLYTLATSTQFYQQRSGGLLGKSFEAGTRIRVALSLFSLPLLVAIPLQMPILLYLMPDFWCGSLAIAIYTELAGTSVSSYHDNFLPTYIITLIEGVIVSATLGLLSLLALWPISMRQGSQPET